MSTGNFRLAWDAFVNLVIPNNATDTIVMEYEKGFYSGAAAIVSLMQSVEYAEHLTEAQRVEIIQHAFNEISERIEELSNVSNARNQRRGADAGRSNDRQAPSKYDKFNLSRTGGANDNSRGDATHGGRPSHSGTDASVQSGTSEGSGKTGGDCPLQ